MPIKNTNRNSVTYILLHNFLNSFSTATACVSVQEYRCAQQPQCFVYATVNLKYNIMYAKQNLF